MPASVREGEVQNSDNSESGSRAGVVLIKVREIRPLARLPAMLAQPAADAALLAGMQAGEPLVGGESHDFH